jgi:hypothetical protein
MANRFPLTLDGSAVKELPSGDNLDLTGSGIVNASSVAATAVTVGGANALTTSSNLSDLANVHTATPTDGQGLQWDNANSRWAPVDASAGGRWTQIASTTLNPAAPVNAVEFTNFVNSAYSEYEIRWSGFSTAANVTNAVDLYMQLALEGYTVNIGGVNTLEAFNNADYGYINWYNRPDVTSPETSPFFIRNRNHGYLNLTQVYEQWNDTYPKSFGKINFTNAGSMVTWECNMHAGDRFSGSDVHWALHRNWGLGYNWGSNGVRNIVGVKLYSASSQNYMQMGTFTLYGLTVT